MFDFAWSEIALIGVVALVAIGPKDMPVAIKAVARAVKKARRMAAEFQTHVDELVREADLQDVRNDINSIRRMDLNAHVARTVDPDGAIRNTLRDDPFRPASPPVEGVQAVGLQPPHEVPTEHASPPDAAPTAAPETGPAPHPPTA